MSLLDMVKNEIKKVFPESEISIDANMLKIELTENDLKRMFMEYSARTKSPFPFPSLDIKIINNKVVLSFRVI
jgi:hypothetical protein